MKQCKHCGFANIDSRKSCLKCNCPLDHNPQKAAKVRIQFDLSKVFSPLRLLQYRISLLLKRKIPQNVNFRNPLVAGFLGFFPGLGALYNHQPGKAITQSVIYFLFLGLVVFTFFETYSNLIIAAFVFYLLCSYADAFVTALLINGQEWLPRHTAAMFFYIMFMVGFIFFAGEILMKPFFFLIQIKQDVLEPTLNYNDQVFVDATSYRIRQPKRGEIVFYNPYGFSFLYSNPEVKVVTVQEENSFERVVGLPGEHVEIIKDKIYIDKKPLAKEFYPFGTNYPENFDFGVIPKNCFLAIFSHTAKDPGFISGIGAAEQPGIKQTFNLKGYDKTCILKRKDIEGRLWFRYNPPKQRQFFPRPETPYLEKEEPKNK